MLSVIIYCIQKHKICTQKQTKKLCVQSINYYRIHLGTYWANGYEKVVPALHTSI